MGFTISPKEDHMRNTLLLLLLMALVMTVVNLSEAQWSWIWRNPSPTGEDISDISSFSSSEYLAITDDHIMRTTDAGMTWSPVNSEFGGTRGFFTDANHGWVCSSVNVGLTTDHGRSWSWNNSGWVTAPDKLVDICFVGNDTGWACGSEGILLKSTDGGITWGIESSGTGNDLHSIWFTSAMVGYVVGDGGTILKTATAGAGWQTKNSYTTQSLKYICAAGSSLFVFGDGGTALKSTDGGATWSSSNSGLSGDIRYASVVDANNIWVVGLGNTVYKTTDGGGTWSSKNPWIGGNIDNGQTITGDFYCACFSSSVSGIVCGKGGALYETTDNGNSWTSLRHGFTTGDASVLSFSDSLRGCLLTDTAYCTTDGGATWRQTPNAGAVKHVQIFHDGTGIRLSGANGTNHFETTSNFGAAWTANGGSEPSGANFPKYDFLDALTGYAFNGTSGAGTWRTTNGGVSWTDKTPSSYMDILGGFSIPNAGTVWLTEWSDGVNVLVTTDGGTTWSNPAAASLGGNRSAIFAFDDKRAWIGSSSGMLYATADGGKNFAAADPKVNGSKINEIKFLSTLIGFVVADNGYISSTIDGGSTWNPVSLGSAAWTRIEIATPNSIFVAGAGGFLVQGVSGSLVAVREARANTSGAYSLDQNYPNPFNPSTTISFVLPSRSFVTLKIYDILGRQVGLLVNEEMEAGSHERTWNAKGCSSGIYLCRLEAGKYSETKKLILLR